MSVTMVKEQEKETPTVNLEKYDIVEVKDNIVTEYKGSKEVDELTKLIVVDEPQSIVEFGGQVANDIGKIADTVLQNTTQSQVNDTGVMMKELAKVMSTFDATELQEEPKGIKKLFTNAQKQLDKILTKYNNMGVSIEKIYVQLKDYQNEISKSNAKLEEMFKVNTEQYTKLEQYILAGEQGVQEITEYLETNTDIEPMQRTNIEQALELLKARIQDLRTAEVVAMQSLPMIKTMEFSNLNLMRKIDSAFIVTLPVFKQSIAQAVLLKRQKIQMDAVAALDEKTNEMLLKNANNTVEQSKSITAMATTSSIKTETLVETQRIIMQGIEDINNIRENAESKRIEDTKQLETMKTEFNNTFRIEQKA